MLDPLAKAKWVMQTKNVGEIPALFLKPIADSENIKYMFKTYPSDWDGALAFQGDKRAILVNTTINNSGRHNFTFAHELGHYFLKHEPNYTENGQCSIRCTISDTDVEQKGREAEANRFAVELLMPEEQFRFDMLGADIDFGLITGLSNRYMVSKQACSIRILSLTSLPCIIVRSNGYAITSYSESRAARGFFKKLNALPQDTAAYWSVVRKWSPNDSYRCSADKWLVSSVPTDTIQECTHVHAESGAAMTILRW